MTLPASDVSSQTRCSNSRVLRALVSLAILATWVSACAPPIPKPSGTLADAKVYPIGANFFLEREVDEWKLDRTARLARDAGIRWAKQQFPWEDIERQQGVYNWAKYDRIVSVFEQYKLDIIARLDRPPQWSRQDNTIEQAPPDDANTYASFVREFVQRYKGRVRYIQVWNEPNAFPEWGNRAVSPVEYVNLLKLAYAAAKQADPQIKVLSAPLAMTLGQPHPEPGKWISMSDLQFLDEMYQAGAKDYFDILSYNAFGFAFAPEDPPSPERLNFQRVALARQIMEQRGDADKAVWVDEYAWNAAPATMPAAQLVWARQAEDDQAAYTVRGYQFAREHWPWMGVMSIWYFRQPGSVPPTRADYYFRMVEPNFTLRPLYLRVREYALTLNNIEDKSP
jgi:polysaccharide biosynthesis protein PslG